MRRADRLTKGCGWSDRWSWDAQVGDRHAVQLSSHIRLDTNGLGSGARNGLRPACSGGCRGLLHLLPRGERSRLEIIFQGSEFQDRIVRRVGAGHGLPRPRQLLQVGPGFFDALRVNAALTSQTRHHQGMVADLVDEPWNAIGRPMNRNECIFGENRGWISAHRQNLCPHVLDRLVALHRFEVATCCDSLVEGSQLRIRKTFVQSRITRQYQTNTRFTLGDQIGDHPDLIQ